MRIFVSRLFNKTLTQNISNNSHYGFDYKTFFYNLIEAKRADNSYRVFKKISRSQAMFPVAQESSHGKQNITIWCSNDYLDLSMHPEVIEAITAAVKKHGSGSGGSRSISGNSPYHEELEKQLAKYHQKEASLVFSSGFVANDTALYTLGKQLPGVHYFSDSGNHSSMITGIRNSGAHKHVFRHNDPKHLEEQLRHVAVEVPKIVVFETIHSMDGSIAPAEEMCDVAHKYGAITFVDEVHAVGMYGPTGAGIGQRDGCVHKMDIISSTLGKAFGQMGGYITGDRDVIDAVRSYGNGFIFTTALPPHVMAGCLASLKILQSLEGRELREKLHKNVLYMKKELSLEKIPVIPGTSHVVPVIVGDAKASTRLSNDLIRRFGIYVQPINYPSVPKGTERLRVAPTPGHSTLMIERFVESLSTLWKEYNLPLLDHPEESKHSDIQILSHQ
ncbi:5-aminolevulinate synthase erythroid-specific mitochondrial [Biomphalaria pfeifferi]|uniref:5-aminolevulinate synthase n=1 Tax=Biomphalaria pfeifferi TaxID=112525 RepID=A0AAD8BNT1_BIOPF|nr:5-aminolevulinate synthase erythroid-specific mitochondrial [Biomphalaria pfeifferi]